MAFTAKEKKILRATARAAIAHCLLHPHELAIVLDGYPACLCKRRASFVTLEREGHLRGCIGSLEAKLPLIQAVAKNAVAAAFSDPRFPPLQARELDALSIHISVLTVPETLAVESEEDLLVKLRPGIDGLVLKRGPQRGTFLPAVWESLPDPRDFLAQLKQKAGLAPGDWPADIEIYRYTAESV